MTMLKKEDILRGLRKIDDMAKKADVLVDLSVYGGAALALAFNIRHATRDVDAVVHGSPDFLRRAATEIAAEEGWPNDWLNDGVKGFTSANEKMQLMENFEANTGGGLRIYTPAPEYLFAMKCMAMRAEGIEGSHDISDIEALADEAKIQDAASALLLVESFYPSSRIPPKVRFGVEEIMEKIVLRRTKEAAQFTDDEPMESLPGEVMRLNTHSGMAEIVRGNGIVAFGGKPAIETFAAEEKLSNADTERLIALDMLGSALGKFREGEGVPLVEQGRHIGPILAIKNGIAIQDSGCGNLVSYDMQKFETPPKAGEKWDVSYSDGLMKSAKNMTNNVSKDGHAVKPKHVR